MHSDAMLFLAGFATGAAIVLVPWWYCTRQLDKAIQQLWNALPQQDPIDWRRIDMPTEYEQRPDAWAPATHIDCRYCGTRIYGRGNDIDSGLRKHLYDCESYGEEVSKNDGE